MQGSRLSTQNHSAENEASPPRPALERLHKKVHRAAEEIERLRAENRALQRRVQELKTRPAIGDEEAFLILEDPDALRAQIERFIDTIDAYLAEDDAPDAPDGARD